jgi:hypothetical protein
MEETAIWETQSQMETSTDASGSVRVNKFSIIRVITTSFNLLTNQLHGAESFLRS